VRLGLELAIFGSSGWSLTGGPWVKPEQAMKKLVWSEINIQRPLKFERKFPQPPSNSVSFGSLRGRNAIDNALSQEVKADGAHVNNLTYQSVL
jgi:hypothetical protein